MELAYIFPGLPVGATGVGGRSIMTPMPTSGFGVAPGIAVGTDPVFAALIKSAGTVAHRAQGSVDGHIAALACPDSLPAATANLLSKRP